MSTTNTNASYRTEGQSKLAAKLQALDAWYDVWCQTDEAKILSMVATGLLMLTLAIVLFGYAALIITALTAVPVIFTVLMLITVGK